MTRVASLRHALLLAGSCFVGFACNRAPEQPAEAAAGGPMADTVTASATLLDAKGDSVGWARLSEVAQGGVDLEIEVTGMSPGPHGAHFHEAGACDGGGATAFGSAGGHYNVAGKKHGLESPEGPHNGDLPNLSVDSAGKGTLRAKTGRVTLGPGPATLFDADSSAIVLHAQADDQRTDPSGNSGGRVACGVVRKIP